VSRRFPLLAWLLLAGVVASAVAPHRHADLDESESGRTAERILSAHDPSSRALHLHAVLRIVEDAPCWACQSHRVSILAGAAPVPGLSAGTRPIGSLPTRAARAVARYTRPSRAPPSPRRNET